MFHFSLILKYPLINIKFSSINNNKDTIVKICKLFNRIRPTLNHKMITSIKMILFIFVLSNMHCSNIIEGDYPLGKIKVKESDVIRIGLFIKDVVIVNSH